MKKVKTLNKKLLFRSGVFLVTSLSIVSTILSFIDFAWYIRIGILVLLCMLSVIMHFVFWNKANKLSSVRLKINNSDLEIFFGDIFKEDDIKIIPFNEYFDTIFDNGMISENSLHGKYIKQLENTDTLNDEIDLLDLDYVVGENTGRKAGRKIKYRLGTILPRVKYFLLAFSHFDENNKAFLTQNDYVMCLLNMWSEIDKLYNGKTVCIPLLGSGITRMKDNLDITDQELLDIMIWSFKISKVKFTYPSKVRIVIYKAKSDKIDLYSLKEVN